MGGQILETVSFSPFFIGDDSAVKTKRDWSDRLHKMRIFRGRLVIKLCIDDTGIRGDCYTHHENKQLEEVQQPWRHRFQFLHHTQSPEVEDATSPGGPLHLIASGKTA